MHDRQASMLTQAMQVTWATMCSSEANAVCPLVTKCEWQLLMTDQWCIGLHMALSLPIILFFKADILTASARHE